MNKLEPDYADAYKAWQQDPSPDNTAAVLAKTEPLLRGAARRYTGDDGPIALGEARRMLIGALPRYDPRQAGMSTFVFQQLQGLQRPAQRINRGVDVPDRVAADRAHADESRRALADEFGREATDDEIMDYARMSPTRYRRALGYTPAVAAGTLDAAAFGEGGFSATGPASTSTMVHDLVYASLSPIDQNIMELAYGRHGRKPMPNQAIALRLKRSPGLISQRKARIQAMIDEMTDSPLTGGRA